jgi:hypothetical protein
MIWIFSELVVAAKPKHRIVSVAKSEYALGFDRGGGGGFGLRFRVRSHMPLYAKKIKNMVISDECKRGERSEVAFDNSGWRLYDWVYGLCLRLSAQQMPSFPKK